MALKKMTVWWHSLTVLQKFLFGCFFLLLILSRFYLLDTIPVGIHYDELVYMLQAKVFALSGSDLLGTWSPWRLMPLTAQHAELTVLVFLPGFWLFADPMLAGRVMSALLGVTFPFVAGWLAWNLWQDKRIFWTTAVVTAANPWVWQLSRMSFDPLPGAWLLFLAAAIMTARNFRYRWLAAFAVFLGFFQYQGYKILVVPWLGIWAYYSAGLQKILSKKTAIALTIFAAALFGFWYAVLLPSQGANQRSQKTVLYDSDFKNQIASNVITDRRLTLDNRLMTIAHNKYQALGEYFVKRYVSNFNLETLFISGEPNLSPFSVWSHGFFYMIDLPLLLLGLLRMFSQPKWRKAAIVWGLLFVIMPLPRLLTTVNDWMIFRGSIGYLLMLLPIAMGLQLLLEQKRWLKWMVVLLYGLFVSRFAYDYFYRYPLYSTNGLYFEQRVLSSYIHRQPAETPVTVYTEFPEFLFYSYLYYNQLVTKESLLAIRTGLQQKEYVYQQVKFTNDCLPQPEDFTGLIIAERSHHHCQPEGLSAAEMADLDLSLKPGRSLSISSPLDSGEIFWIYGDSLCQNEELSTFVDVRFLDGLTVERLDDPQFCRLWIKDLNSLREFSPIDSR